MVSFNGSGESAEDPVVISDVSGHFEAIDAEYAFLARKYGMRGVDWQFIRQSLLNVDGRMIDHLEIQLSDGTKVGVFFDISDYFGKF